MRTFDLQDNYLDKNDPWSGALSATVLAVRGTYHTMLQATPCQVVFGNGMILNTPFIADWEAISLRKQKIIETTNLKIKNSKPNTYRIQDKVVVRNKKVNKYKDPYVGPYPIP